MWIREKLGSLHAEGDEHLRRVATCESYHGYLKTVPTFDALAMRALLLVDIATIPRDLVAQDRGYAAHARFWSGSVSAVLTRHLTILVNFIGPRGGEYVEEGAEDRCGVEGSADA